MAVDRFIIIRNVHLEGKNDLIVAKKVTNILIAESQKIKRWQKWKLLLRKQKQKIEINMKRKFGKVQMNNKAVQFQMDTSSDMTLIKKENWQTNSIKDGKIAHGIVRNKPKFVGECYINITFIRIRYESNPEPIRLGLGCVIWHFEKNN